jgi:mannose-6-phosphate isomerase
MTIELALTHALPKPWGVVDLRPWNRTSNTGVAIGEIWYDRPGKPSLRPSLLLKLLFTGEPLSIQVHPNDAYARSMGLPNGKTEAWYVLSAAAGARVALGLSGRLSRQQLRRAVDDGSIANLVMWQTVFPDDVIFVPAGTIHAIGAGLVIAEIQQRSEATFRLFDHGRQRELHIERAMAVANAGPAPFRVRPNRFTEQRVLLVSGPHFVLERIDLSANSTWCLEAKRETWLLVLSGNGLAGSLEVAATDAVFAQSDRIAIRAGGTGMVGLVAYTGVGPVPHLLQCVAQSSLAHAARPPKAARMGALLHASKGGMRGRAAGVGGHYESNSPNTFPRRSVGSH